MSAISGGYNGWERQKLGGQQSFVQTLAEPERALFAWLNMDPFRDEHLSIKTIAIRLYGHFSAPELYLQRATTKSLLDFLWIKLLARHAPRHELNCRALQNFGRCINGSMRPDVNQPTILLLGAYGI